MKEMTLQYKRFRFNAKHNRANLKRMNALCHYINNTAKFFRFQGGLIWDPNKVESWNFLKYVGNTIYSLKKHIMHALYMVHYTL